MRIEADGGQNQDDPDAQKAKFHKAIEHLASMSCRSWSFDQVTPLFDE